MQQYLCEASFSTQGDAGESAVALVLQRHGFKVNQISKDYYGWDMIVEHKSSPSDRVQKKYEFLVQVKSTRLLDKETIQISLSALLNLIESPSVCVVAFVSFASGGIFPDCISFAHIDEKIMKAARAAYHEALRTETKFNEKWVTISTSEWTKCRLESTGDVDLYKLYSAYRDVFGDHYALGKEKMRERFFPVLLWRDPSVATSLLSGAEYQDFSAWRANLGLTQRKIAEALGVHLHSVKKWERFEREPDTELCLAMAAVSAKLAPTDVDGATKVSRLAMAASSAGLMPVRLIDVRRKTREERKPRRGRPSTYAKRTLNS